MKKFAVTVFCLILLPTTVLLITQGLGILSADIANIVRAIFHGLFFLFIITRAMLPSVMLTPTSARDMQVWGISVLLILALTAALISAIYNTVEMDEIFRIGVLSMFSSTLLLFYRHYWRKRHGLALAYYITLSKLYVALMVIIALYAGYIYLSNQSPYYRLGYPLMPAVFAYYLLIAFVVVITILPNRLLAIIFALAVVLSGTRLASALLLGCIFVVWIFRRKASLAGMLPLLVVATAIAVILQVRPDLLRNFLVERNDFFSGRGLIWQQLLVLLANPDIFWLGLGAAPSVYLGNLAQELSAHNSFLELTLSYGFPYAVVSYLIWFIAFAPFHRGQGGENQTFSGNPAYVLKINLFLVVTAHSVLGNFFWQNMGDPGTLFACLLLLGPMVQCPVDDPIIETQATSFSHRKFLPNTVSSHEFQRSMAKIGEGT